MKSREFVLPFVTGLAIFSMSIFISCASQSRIDEDGNEVEETSVSESGGDTGSAAKKAVKETKENLGDLPPEENKLAENAPPPAEGTPPPADVPPPGGELSDLPPPDATPPAADTLPPATDKIAEAAPPPGADALPPADQSTLPPSDLPPVAPTDLPPLTEEKPKRSRRAKGGGGGVPKIPANAVVRGKTALNRFYFVRNGDTKDSVAQFIYGDASKAKDLAKWNKGEFAPGRLVFYQSPQNPADKEMKPLYQEKGITPVDYVIKKGDWLSRIAANKLGSPASWKEVAVTNGIDRPQAIEVGQRLVLYPVGSGDAQAMASNDTGAPPPEAAPLRKGSRKKHGKKETLAENAPSNPNFAPSPEASAPITNAEAPMIQPENSPAAAVSIPPPVPAETAPVETFKKKKKPAGGFDLLRLVEQNIFFLILGLGVAVLVAALIFVNKRRKAKAAEAEFGDDAFASPKAKRR